MKRLLPIASRPRLWWEVREEDTAEVEAEEEAAGVVVVGAEAAVAVAGEAIKKNNSNTKSNNLKINFIIIILAFLIKSI